MYDKGTKVIIRSAESGVHHGTLADYSLDGGWVRLENSRRLWSWKTTNDGISLTEIAIAGIDQKESKITDTLPDIIVIGVCEIIPTFGMADVTIEGAPVAKA